MNQIVLVGIIKEFTDYNYSVLLAYKDAGDSKTSNDIYVQFSKGLYGYLKKWCTLDDLIGIKGYISGLHFDTHIVAVSITDFGHPDNNIERG